MSWPRRHQHFRVAQLSTQLKSWKKCMNLRSKLGPEAKYRLEKSWWRWSLLLHTVFILQYSLSWCLYMCPWCTDSYSLVDEIVYVIYLGVADLDVVSLVDSQHFCLLNSDSEASALEGCFHVGIMILWLLKTMKLLRSLAKSRSSGRNINVHCIPFGMLLAVLLSQSITRMIGE